MGKAMVAPLEDLNTGANQTVEDGACRSLVLDSLRDGGVGGIYIFAIGLEHGKTLGSQGSTNVEIGKNITTWPNNSHV